MPEMAVRMAVIQRRMLETVSSILLWITAILTAISGVTYIREGTKVIDFSK